MKTTVLVHDNRGVFVEEHTERQEELCSKEEHIDFYNEHGDSYHELIYRKDLRELYKEEFSEAIDAYNAKQKKKSRQLTIDKYMKSVADDTRGKRQTKKVNGKNVINEDARQGKQLCYEVNISVGNTEREKDADGKTLYDDHGHHVRPQYLPRDLQRSILRRYAETFQENNPNFKVKTIALHGDEGFYNKRGEWEYSLDHLHIAYVPIAHGYKTGLSVQNSLNKAFAEMGFDGADCQKKWHDRETNRLEQITHEEYQRYCEEHPDFYVKNGDLSIVHPVAEKTKQGGLTKEQYSARQELDEDINILQGMENSLQEAVNGFNQEVERINDRDKAFLEAVGEITGEKYEYNADEDYDYANIVDDVRTWGKRKKADMSKKEKSLDEREQALIKKETSVVEQARQNEQLRLAYDKQFQILEDWETDLNEQAKQNELIRQANEIEKESLKKRNEAEMQKLKSELERENKLMIQQKLAEELKKQVEDVRDYRHWKREQTAENLMINIETEKKENKGDARGYAEDLDLIRREDFE